MIATIEAAASAIRAGTITPRDLLQAHLERIDRLEPDIRAWVHIDRAGALAAALALTRELTQGQWRGPLHGIPMGIKDIIDVFDMPTACGSRLWEQSSARRDATVVARLRQAGAIILGKTVTTAYASFDPPPTRNPWNWERTPGGSSSGSAAALAAGMCLATIGSQTGGSLTRPASYCGVAACKPTLRRVSVDGVLPLAPSMDHIGPMANGVRDLALVLQVIAGLDPRDPASADRGVPDYLAGLGGDIPAPLLGVAPALMEEYAEKPMLSLLQTVIQSCRFRGASIIELALPSAFADVLSRHRTVMAVEAAAYHESRLKRHPEDYPPNVRELLEEGMACPAPEYARCKDHQRELTIQMAACLEGVDALLVPATTGPAPPAATTGNPAFNSPWSFTGLPSVSLPASWTPDGLPLAIQLIAKPWHEAQLFRTAVWCEEILQFEHREELPWTTSTVSNND